MQSFTDEWLLPGLVLVPYLLVLAGAAYVAWLVLRILYRAAYPQNGTNCPHCGNRPSG